MEVSRRLTFDRFLSDAVGGDMTRRMMLQRTRAARVSNRAAAARTRLGRIPKELRQGLQVGLTCIRHGPELKVKDVRFMAGEHDASLDRGEAYREFFGDLHYAFDHKGIHFIVLDNVSDPAGAIGAAQLEWLRADLDHLDREAPIVVLTHRPLFDLAPDWDWATRDGAAALGVLMSHRHVTVFYGHIHQEHHHQTEHIAHHAAKGLMYPLPAPMSVPKKAPLPWDPAKPYGGLGLRTVDSKSSGASYALTELPVVKV